MSIRIETQISRRRTGSALSHNNESSRVGIGGNKKGREWRTGRNVLRYSINWPAGGRVSCIPRETCCRSESDRCYSTDVLWLYICAERGCNQWALAKSIWQPAPLTLTERRDPARPRTAACAPIRERDLLQCFVDIFHAQIFARKATLPGSIATSIGRRYRCCICPHASYQSGGRSHMGNYCVRYYYFLYRYEVSLEGCDSLLFPSLASVAFD